MRIPSSFLRFLASGAANTVATYLLYLILLRFLPYQVSYTISYICGIGLAFVLSRYFVFEARPAGKRAFLFPGVYLVQYLLGLLIVYIWVDALHWPAVAAPLASIAMSIPVTYMLSKWIFNSDSRIQKMGGDKN